MFLIIALVPKDLVAGLAEELQLGLLLLHLLQGCDTTGHRRRVALTTALARRVHLHVLAESHGGPKDPAALCARVLPLTFVHNFMSVQQGLRREENAAGLTMIRQRKIVLVVLVVHLLLYDALHWIQQSRALFGGIRRFGALRRGLCRRITILLRQIHLGKHYHRVIVFGKL